VIREPIRFGYRGFEVEVMPPPSAGGVAVTQMLLMLDGLEAFRLPHDSSAALHLFIEAARRAHAERRFGVLDPDSAGYDADLRLRRWLNPRTLLDSTPPIDPKRATPSSAVSPFYKAALRELEHTTHFSVTDAEGNAVSCTTTLSASFGAKFVVPKTGIVMNNSLAAFGTVGDSVPVAGQRMTSSMTPTLVLEQDRPVAVLGTPGGDTIPNTVVQVIRNLVDYRMTLDDAVDAPRIHHGFVPDVVRWEAEHPLAASTLKELEALGHHFTRRRVIGDANSIVVRYDGSSLVAWGYADPREGGLAAAPP
jgi:gamma-glutamyltranspeptidase/glutathione hydrolase